ncbi:cytoplasmic incompatibility factor CifB [Wolbachia endosymbiont (group A) of Longitarsus flavicornis]|uniref:cytoplasmic incompatibility factor CifB n=1 Tax=Wolbachia endosymbiont (group A) of Longitarsus flavicornis TaxID=3066134 RepID=UPI0030CA3656
MNNGDGFIRSLVNKNLEGFRREFESFLDQCPSFLYHVGTGRFLPVFFFSMFATAHDAGILAPDERVYIRFDNHGIDTDGRNRSTGNLKVAVLTNKSLGKKRVVRCYSISDVPNSDGLRFSEREKNSLVQEIGRENRDLREEGLSFEQYKVCTHGKGKSQGEKGAVVFEEIREKDSRGGDRFAKYSASEINLIRVLLEDHELTIKEIEGMDLDQNQHGQLDELVDFVQIALGQQRIDNFAEMLRSGVVRTLRDNSTVIFRYITRIYRNYAGTLENDIQDRNQKFESHGFLLGFLANFSHLCTIDIDLNLSLVNSYVAFLVHHQAERENIPIVINIGWRTLFALERARGDAQRLHASSFIPVHTESGYAVCVGLNFNSHLAPFRVGIAELQQNRFPLVQRLFECVEDGGIRENVIDFLLQHFPIEIPRNAENRDRILDCITGFAFGNSAFDHEQVLIQNNRLRVIKYIFRYDNENLRKHALTMVFHAQGFPIVILDIRNPHDIRSVKAIALPPGYNGAVNRVTYILNDQYGLNVLLDRFNSPDHYLRITRYASFDGNLIEVPNAENVHNTLNQVMNDGWQSIPQHRELLRAISRVLMPDNMNGNAIIDVSNNDKFRSILHSIFYVCDNPDKVVTAYKVGQTYSPDIRMAGEVSTRVTEQRLGLLLLRSTINHPEDTHPIGYVLGFANTQQALAQERRNAEQQITRLMDKQRGYLPITPGNEVVLSYAVFNAGAQRVEDLISVPQELYIHRFDRSHASGRTRGLLGPNSVIDENPPEGLLSDQTRENLINYIRENPGRNRILPFDLGDNRCVTIITFEGSIQQLLEILRSRIRGGDNSIPTAQEIRRQIRDILRNQGIEVNDLLTLEFATRNGHYDYWLQQIDIAHAGRLRYQLRTEGNHTFEVANLARNDGNEHIVRVLNQFRENEEQQRLTLIITLNNTHWVTLVIERQNGNYVGYYADSTATAVPGGIIDIIQNNLGNNIRINNVSVRQQTDGWNCGLWALENATDINRVLNENPGEQVQNVVNIMRDFLGRGHPNRDRNYFQNIRVSISQLFRNDPGFQDVQLQAYIQNREQIDPLLRTYLELGYHRVGGGCGPVEAPISLSVSDSSNFGGLPQSSLEGPEASRVSDLSKGKGGR